MIIDEYFSSLRNLSCHCVEKFEKNLLFLNFKHKFKKPPVFHRHIMMYCACSLLLSGGSVCLANLGGSCLHSGGSWRPGVPSLFKLGFLGSVLENDFWTSNFIFLIQLHLCNLFKKVV